MTGKKAATQLHVRGGPPAPFPINGIEAFIFSFFLFERSGSIQERKADFAANCSLS